MGISSYEIVEQAEVALRRAIATLDLEAARHATRTIIENTHELTQHMAVESAFVLFALSLSCRDTCVHTSMKARDLALAALDYDEISNLV